MEKVNSSDRFSEVISKKSPVLVDAYATWCGPCKTISPEIEKLAIRYKDITFIKFDCDEIEELAADLEISSLPTFLLYKNGKIVDRVSGANLPKIQKMLQDC